MVYNIQTDEKEEKVRAMKKIKFVSILISAFVLLGCLLPTAAFAAEGNPENIRNAVAGLAVGDVDKNGVINVSDATVVQKYIALILNPDSRGRLLADVNYDGKINVNDVTHIQKLTAGLVYSLSGKKGVDISSANGSVDMQLVKDAGYEFVMLRCGFGDDQKDQDDRTFEENVQKCEQLNIPWGVYLYSYALTIKEANSEVAHVLRLLNGKKPTLPIAFDMEDADGYKERYGMPSNSELVNICKVFINGISEAGYYPILYSNLNWFETKLNDAELLTMCDIWLAQWNAECQFEGENIGMWQYGGEVNYLESNTIEGVGTVDKNFCFRDYPTIIRKGGYNGW